MAIYEYSARCLRVIDAENVEMEIDLGFRINLVQRLRIIDSDIGACFIHEGKAKEAKKRVQSLLIDDVNSNWGKYPLLIHTEESTMFGYMAKVLVFVDFTNINPHNTQKWDSVRSILLDEGLATPHER